MPLLRRLPELRTEARHTTQLRDGLMSRGIRSLPFYAVSSSNPSSAAPMSW